MSSWQVPTRRSLAAADPLASTSAATRHPTTRSAKDPRRSTLTPPTVAAVRIVKPFPRRPCSGGDDAVRQHAELLDLGLELVAGLEELAERRADALGRSRGDDVAGQEREALREDGDALVDRKDHLRGVARLPRLAVHAERDRERLGVGDLVGGDERGPHRAEGVEGLPLEPRSEEHTSELQSHSDLHSFPTRRSSDLSPGRSVKPCERTATHSSTGKIIFEVWLDCRVSPFTRSAIASAWGSGISSAVTSAGPIGQKVSRDFPLNQDRKSTRLNSSHTVIYTLSLHDALPICRRAGA